MLLTITNTKSPETDLGYLLHKNPRRVQSFELSFGKAHVFYPEALSSRCTVASLLDVDPWGSSERGADPRAKAACWTSTSSNLTDSRHLNEVFFDTL